MINGTAILPTDILQWLGESSDQRITWFEELLWQYMPIPLDELFAVPSINQSILSDINPDDKYFSEAKRRFFKDLKQMSLMDIVQSYKEPVFDLNKQYLSVSKSTKYIDQWLDFQFGNNKMQFLTDFFHITNKNGGKPNAIWLCGPPNSGKKKKLLIMSCLHDTT